MAAVEEQEEQEHAGAGTTSEYHCVHGDLFYNARTLHGQYSKVAFNQKERFDQVRQRASLVYILIGLSVCRQPVCLSPGSESMFLCSPPASEPMIRLLL
jgi:hypothetical protein